MESGFDQLEQKVRKAADVVRGLRTENKSLQEELSRLRGRLHDAEKTAAEKPKGAPPEDTRKLDALGKEIEGLRAERDEIRRRIAKLVQVLDALDAQE